MKNPRPPRTPPTTARTKRATRTGRAADAATRTQAPQRAPPPTLILASESPARKRLLKRLGFKFKTTPAHIDEASFKAKTPRELVQRLATEKARTVARDNPRAVVVGSDQMLVLDNKIFGKPHTEANARKQLAQCSGKTAELLTAVTIVKNERDTTFLNVTKLAFRKLTAKEIAEYVAEDKPLACAGSFMIEKAGIRLFSRIETTDPTAIEGLPTLELHEKLLHALNA